MSQKVLNRKLRINLQKYHFAKLGIELPDYKILQTGISPLESKTAAILAKPPSTTIKRLRLFPGSVHYIRKFSTTVKKVC